MTKQERGIAESLEIKIKALKASRDQLYEALEDAKITAELHDLPTKEQIGWWKKVLAGN